MKDQFIVVRERAKGLQTVGNKTFSATVDLAFVKSVGAPEETLSISLISGGEPVTVTVPFPYVVAIMDKARKREAVVSPTLAQKIIEGRIT